MSREELQKALRLVHRDHFAAAYLTPALEAGLIEMTIPAKPRSPLQKYRLTDAGRALRVGLTKSPTDPRPNPNDPKLRDAS